MNSHIYSLESKYVIVEIGHKLKIKSFLPFNSIERLF